MKAIVKIEETLCRAIEVEVPDGSTLDSDAVRKATNNIIDAYKGGSIVLTADDYNGTQVCVEIEDGQSTGWYY